MRRLLHESLRASSSESMSESLRGSRRGPRRDTLREAPQGAPHETPREALQEAPQETLREVPREAPREAAQETPQETLREAAQRLRAELDAAVVGHPDVKEALLLGLIAEEHLYLQGDPGCAKTLLAELLAKGAGWRFFLAQMHRDLRMSELAGGIRLRRQTHIDANGRQSEQIAQEHAGGALLDAELALLDDITRAPGEALNVLLRILNERRFGKKVLPLRMAVATTNPTTDRFFNEPLDPAHLDRFTLQLRVEGLVQRKRWPAAREILRRYEGESPPPVERVLQNVAPRATERRLWPRTVPLLRDVAFPPSVERVYRAVLAALVGRHGCHPQNSLLSDRTMLVRVPRLMRARALLHGRAAVSVDDLQVLRYVLTFRVPPAVYELLDAILQAASEVAAEAEEAPEPQEAETNQENATAEASDSAEDELANDETQNDENAAEEGLTEEMHTSAEEDSAIEQHRRPLSQQASGSGEGVNYRSHSTQDVENIDLLLESISGQLERSRAEQRAHPAGAPRRYQAMRRLDEFADVDSAEAAVWLSYLTPRLPRTLRREKKDFGGRVVIVRDISQSMEGRFARWTSSVVTRLIEVVRRQRMRIGYIEFNHASLKYEQEGRFFTRDYDTIIRRAGNVSCSGVTNYQYPLRDALEALRGGREKNKHILFLTDGEPTQGDWMVRTERTQARRMGVFIHTIFIGTTECPEILDILSEESGGARFLAVPNEQGRLSISERQSAAAGNAFRARGVYPYIAPAHHATGAPSGQR